MKIYTYETLEQLQRSETIGVSPDTIQKFASEKGNTMRRLSSLRKWEVKQVLRIFKELEISTDFLNLEEVVITPLPSEEENKFLFGIRKANHYEKNETFRVSELTLEKVEKRSERAKVVEWETSILPNRRLTRGKVERFFLYK